MGRLPVFTRPLKRSQRGPIRRWWLLIALIGALAVAWDFVEFYRLGQDAVSADLRNEILLEGLVLPAMIAILVTALERTTVERTLAMQRLTQRELLFHQMSAAPDWPALMRAIAGFPGGIVPLDGSALLVAAPADGALRLEAIWGFAGMPPPDYANEAGGMLCRVYPLTVSPAALPPAPCICSHPAGKLPGHDRHCLPLIHAGRLAAILQIYLPAGYQLTYEQDTLLKILAPEMALAIENARNQRRYDTLKAETDAERRQVARHLHDNLAQSLVYLRHKLDQLTGEDGLVEIANIERDLLRMREVTNEAYLSVRNTLKEMESGRSTNLSGALQECVRLFKGQVSFGLSFSTQGQPRPLPAAQVSQVFYILKEALANVEKHAGASNAQVCLDWEAKAVTLRVQDDGCGFDWPPAADDGHLGLSIMQERAGDLGGRLSVKSAPGAGTEVTLRLPLPDRQAAGEWVEASPVREGV